MVGAGNFVCMRVLANAAVFRYRLGLCVTAPVVQVHATTTIAYLASFNPHVHQAFAELSILSAVLHSLVETIGGKNMLFPGDELCPFQVARVMVSASRIAPRIG